MAEIQVGDVCLVWGHPHEHINNTEVEVVDIVPEGHVVMLRGSKEFLPVPYTVYLIEGPACPVNDGFYAAAKRHHLIKKGNPDAGEVRAFDIELET